MVADLAIWIGLGSVSEQGVGWLLDLEDPNENVFVAGLKLKLGDLVVVEVEGEKVSS